MQLSKLFQHFSTAAALLLVTSAAATAFGQDADLGLVVTPPPAPAAPNPLNRVLGATVDYAVSITNAGPAHATGIEVSGILPVGTRLARATGCELAEDINGDPIEPPAFPCTVPGTLFDGPEFSAKATIFVEYVMPDPAPTTCTLSLPDISFSVSSATPEDAATLGNNVQTLPIALDPYADVETEMSGPEDADVGDLLEFTVTVRNNGPCNATTVRARAAGASLVANGLLYQSATGPCASLTDSNADGVIDDNDRCELGDMPPGASITYRKTYEVDGLPEDIMSTGLVNGVVAASAAPSFGVFDPDRNNNAAVTQTVVTQEIGRCSALGFGTPASLLAVVALLGMRRRRVV